MFAFLMLPERVVGRVHVLGHNQQQYELPMRLCGAMFATTVVCDRSVFVRR